MHVPDQIHLPPTMPRYAAHVCRRCEPDHRQHTDQLDHPLPPHAGTLQPQVDARFS